MTNPRSYSTSSDSSHILLRAKGIGKKKDDGTWLFRNVDFEVKQGVLTVTGASGVGKSTLLKCINQTTPMDEGQVWLYDKTPDQLGIPTWRSRVMYIPQRTAIMEGTPSDFVQELKKFTAHKKNTDTHDDPVQIGLDWDIRPELWHSKWSTLSGGEMQRIMLAIGCSFRPEVLLLDEPTSALDEESCSKVEKTLKELNCIWVTHNPQQAKRISSAGTLVMRGGDNSVANSLSGVVIDGEEPTNGSSVKSQSKKASSPSTGSSSTNPSH